MKRVNTSTSASSRKLKQTVVGYSFPLRKTNFIIIAAAAVMIIVGFIMMSGGATADGSFNPEIFSTTRIVVGPTFAFLGFILVGVGIMWPARKPTPNTQNDENTIIEKN